MLKFIPECQQLELFPDAPVDPDCRTSVKLLTSIEYIAIVAADTCRLHELTISARQDPPAPGETPWNLEPRAVAVPAPLWFEQTIRRLANSLQQRQNRNSGWISSGRITLLPGSDDGKTISDFRVCLDLGTLTPEQVGVEQVETDCLASERREKLAVAMQCLREIIRDSEALDLPKGHPMREPLALAHILTYGDESKVK